MDEDRLKHAIAVARKMIQIAKDMGLPENKVNDCFIIGYNHDIGYDRRLEDIKNRYGENSIVYEKCLKLVEKIR